MHAGENPRDGFRGYHEAVDEAFGEMLRNLEPPRETEAAPSPQSLIPDLPPPAVRNNAPPMLPSREAAVESFAARFWNGRTPQLKAALWRLNRMRPALEQILINEGVPARFAAVVLVESGATAAAVSPKEALGLWQLIPETARRYGLVVSEHRDDRIDLAQATRAAARYLRDLHAMFGDWRLALAAYNAGEGAIRTALDRAQAASFDELAARRLIPRETREYVPAVLAAINLLAVSRDLEEARLHLQP